MLYEPSRALLQRWFPADVICAVDALRGGTVNDVYRIETMTGVFVLRIATPAGSLDAALCEHAWVTHIAARMPEVLAPLATVAGETALVEEGRVSSLLPFVDGDAPSRFRREHRRAAAHTLARIHLAAASIHDPLPRPGWPAWYHLRWQDNARWNWPTLRRMLPAAVDAPDHVDTAALAEALERHIAVLPVALHELAHRSLTAHPLHGDYSAANLRVRNDRIVAVFDWDESRLDWRACELADAAWAFSRHVGHDGFELDTAREFLEAYCEAGGQVTAAERGVLVLLMRARRLWETLYFLGRWQHGDEITWDYIAANVRELELMEGVEAL